MNDSSVDKLLIALPTLNEYGNLQQLIPEIKKSFPKTFLLFIDDGSSDGTLTFLQKLSLIDSQVKVINRKRRLGIGSAHLCAMKYAQTNGFDYLVTMDADLTHRVQDVQELAQYLKTHDLVIGSRYINKDSIMGWPKFRKFLTISAHFATRFFFASNLDMSSGLRGYRVKSIPIQKLEENCKGNYEFFFQSTLVYLYGNLRISESPITLWKRGHGKSKMNLNLMIRGVFTLIFYGLKMKRIK